FVLAVALDCRLHPLAVEGDVLVADVARPWVDALHRDVGSVEVVGAERHRLAAVVVDVGAGAEQGTAGDQQRQRLADAQSRGSVSSLQKRHCPPPFADRGYDRQTDSWYRPPS